LEGTANETEVGFFRVSVFLQALSKTDEMPTKRRVDNIIKQDFKNDISKYR
jgi:hypothetical protein